MLLQGNSWRLRFDGLSLRFWQKTNSFATLTRVFFSQTSTQVHQILILTHNHEVTPYCSLLQPVLPPQHPHYMIGHETGFTPAQKSCLFAFVIIMYISITAEWNVCHVSQCVHKWNSRLLNWLQVEPLRSSLHQCKSDNSKMASSLDTLLKDNARLQAQVDGLQDKLDKAKHIQQQIRDARSEQNLWQ